MLIATTAMVATAATPSSTETKAQTPAGPLASWNNGPAKQAILDFVRATTDQSSKDFVPPEERIATFDQDGTLWVEHPLYTQAMFALYRVHELSSQHPEWQSQEPFKAVLSNDLAALGSFTEHDWAEILAVTHTGMSQAAFLEIVRQWIGDGEAPEVQATFHRTCLSADD